MPPPLNTANARVSIQLGILMGAISISSYNEYTAKTVYIFLSIYKQIYFILV